MREEHVVSPRIYLAVFGALLLLTLVTVQVAAIDLGEPELLFGIRVPLNVVVALAIACLKAVLVVLFFMHVKYSPRLTQMVIGAAFVWLFILLSVTLADYLSRGWVGGNPGT